jgi:uncharacterized protein YjbI with pentapeptide repeats
MGRLQYFAGCLLLTGLFLARPCAALGPPPVITVQPSSQTVLYQGTATFSVTATSGTGMSYQWLKNSANISGATSSSYTIVNAQTTDAGTYSVTIVNGGGSTTSDPATLTVDLPPTITTQPLSQTVTAGQNVTFSVAASSTTSLGYQWYFNGTALPGATSSTLSLGNVQTNNAGNYTVVVSNVAGSVTSGAATLTVNVPPGITTQPLSKTVTVGQNVIFSVAAGGTAPLSYQWSFNGAALSGATSSALTLSNVQTSIAGSYSVVVANVAGSATSAVATLTVYVPPGITSQPQSQTTIQGQNASFSVTASGTAPLSYQWNFNGAALSGATSSELTLSNVQTRIAGNYSVVVTNIAGSITSAAATLIVTNPVVALSFPVGAAMASDGFTFQLSVPVGSTYVILASTDLQAWTPIATNVAATATVVFTDSAAASHPNRFYQAIVW